MTFPRVFALGPAEDWICDRFVDEWNSFSPQACPDPAAADVIWLLADWCWRRSQSFDCFAMRAAYGLPQDGYLIGSFQRDTEGCDLRSPKLEKGPDLLCDALERIATTRSDVLVVLAGWRRQYVEGRLLRAGIRYRKFERPPTPALRDLYRCLDLYMVTARHEGGPQAIPECAALGVPIVSTHVGIAPEILAPESIGSDVMQLRPNVEHAYRQVQKLMLPQGMTPFHELFRSLVES
jgi:glycosyltransferase involved in cell wall biosynthesis